MGETIALEHLKVIIAMAEDDPAIVRVKKHFSIYRSPEDIFLQLTAVFSRELTTRQVTGAIENITHRIQTKYPNIRHIFIEPVSK